MGLLKNLFGTKSEAKPENVNTLNTVYSPVIGKPVALDTVADPVFAEGTIGKGAAVIPEQGKLYAPVSGTVIALFPSGHALGIQTEQGMEVLVHIGIDTVEMNGTGFESYISINDKVKKGQLLISFDIEKIKKAGYDPTVMVVVSNSENMGNIQKTDKTQVTQEDSLFWFCS